MIHPNPWLSVTATDYEGYMGSNGTNQLAPLSEVFGQVYRKVHPRRVALLGCSTGNGLEHIDPNVTQRVVGVDLNIQYVAVARQRFLNLGASLELYCGDVLSIGLQPGGFDLVHVALLFEYVPPRSLIPRIAEWLAPGGVCASVVLLSSGEGWQVPPPNEELERLESAQRLVSPTELSQLFEEHGLRRAGAWEIPLGDGKRFHTALFRKPTE